VLVALVIALVHPAAPAAADAISDKRAEAERISRQLEQQSRQLAILAEDYDEARVRVTSIQKELADAKAKLQATDAQAGEIKSRLKDQAVASYVRGGAMPTIALLADTKTTEDIGVRTQYVRTITAGAGDVLDELREVRMQLDEQRDRLDAAQADATAAADLAETKRKQAATAQAAQRRTLAEVQGELADLVEAEAKRKAEEEARRVQAELAAKAAKAKAEADAKAARDAAARSKATTTTTAGSSSGTVRRTTTTTTAAPRSGSGGTAPGADTGSGSSGSPAAGADAAIAEAKRQLGKPYEYGGAGPDSFDCSGLTSWAWRAGGKSLSHSSRAQWSETSRVSMSDLQPGDLLFYGSPIHHVGLYVGSGQMIEAPETGKDVRYASIYRSDLVGVGRVN
jgi:cell wall-associated NlpC family hydrolase